MRAARRIADAQRMLGAGIPTPGATYLPYMADRTENEASGQRTTRASGGPLPPINVITGDTVSTRTVQDGDAEYFVPDENSTAHDNVAADIDGRSQLNFHLFLETTFQSVAADIARRS